MSVSKPRNRLVNFRLSEEEFLLLQTTSEVSGARSLSDFARSAVLRAIEQARQPAPASDVASMIGSLDAKLQMVLERLASGDTVEAAGTNGFGSH